MSKLQRFRASVAEIFIYGSLGAYVWQLSDWVANRNIDCGTALNPPRVCYFNLNALAMVGNPNYHFNYWVFVSALVALVIGIGMRLRLGSPFSGQSQSSYFGKQLSSLGYTCGGGAFVVILLGVLALFVMSLTPGTIIGAAFPIWVIVGWLVVVAVFCSITWTSLPKTNGPKPPWRSVTIEEQFKDVSLADLIEFIDDDFSTLTRLRNEYASNPSEERFVEIKIFEEALRRALSHFFNLENKVEIHYFRLRALGDKYHEYQELLQISALISS
jgi:hypothetical protein